MHLVDSSGAGGIFFGRDARQPATAQLNAPFMVRVDGTIVGETDCEGVWTSRKIGRERVALWHFFLCVSIVEACTERA